MASVKDRSMSMDKWIAKQNLMNFIDHCGLTYEEIMDAITIYQRAQVENNKDEEEFKKRQIAMEFLNKEDKK